MRGGEPIFTGRLTRLTSDKRFAYVLGRFNTRAYPKIALRKSSEEINVSVENLVAIPPNTLYPA